MEKDYSDIIFNSHLGKLQESQQQMLLEISNKTVSDVIQYVLAAAAEYGLSLSVAGAPAAPAAETIIDAIFASDAITGTVGSVSNATKSLKKSKQIVSQVLALRDLSGGFDSFYRRVKRIWQDVAERWPGQMEELNSFVETAKEEISELLESFADSIAKSVKVAIPDATAGLAISQVIKSLLSAATNNIYTVLTGALGQSELVREFVKSPTRARQVTQAMFDSLIEMMNTVAEHAGSDSFVGKLGRAAAAGAVMAGPLGMLIAAFGGGPSAEAGIRAVARFIASKKDTIVELIYQVFSVLLPAILGLAASMQILLKGEWKSSSPSRRQVPDPKEQPEPEQPAGLNEAVFSDVRFKKLAKL